MDVSVAVAFSASKEGRWLDGAFESGIGACVSSTGSPENSNAAVTGTCASARAEMSLTTALFVIRAGAAVSASAADAGNDCVIGASEAF